MCLLEIVKSNNYGFVTCEQHLSPLTVDDAAQLPTSSSCCELEGETRFVKVSDRRVVEVSRLEVEWHSGSFSLRDLHVILH